jgi:hypothetical protein
MSFLPPLGIEYRWIKSKNEVIRSIIHHCQNTLESIWTIPVLNNSYYLIIYVEVSLKQVNFTCLAHTTFLVCRFVRCCNEIENWINWKLRLSYWIENCGEIRNDKNSEKGLICEVRNNYFSVVTIDPVSITFLITYQIRPSLILHPVYTGSASHMWYI